MLIGQSNMAGRAPYTPVDAHEIPGVFLLDSEDLWEPASNPLNRYSTIRKDLSMQKMNPGYSFSLAMREAQPERELGLVVNARGGSKIEEWSRDSEYYQEALRRTKIALKDGTLRGILWHQGEANANDPAYLDKISQLIRNFREDLDAPEIPFIAGQINTSGDYLFNQLILQLPSVVEHTAVVSNQGLTAMDRWHFDHDSMILLGQRYAEKMLMLEPSVEPFTE
nr:sialate O-acetylesterase [Puniceicoccus vermicola]